MTKYVLWVLVLFSCQSNTNTKGTKIDVDSVVNEKLLNNLCNTIESSKEKNDSIRVFQSYEKHLSSILKGLDSSQVLLIMNRVYYRLQRSCRTFSMLLKKMDPDKNSDWERSQSRPISNASQEICKEFFEIKDFSYLETTGDTVRLRIADGFWVEDFKDGTFSKLKINWINDCEFQIEFVESNNEIRKNFSTPGDKYSYLILDKKNGFYTMSAEIVGMNDFTKFKLYF
jgi:hypothetical protein